MKRIISAIAVLVFLLLSACGAEKQNTLNFSISSSGTKVRWEDGEDAFYVGDEKVTWEEFRKFCDEDRSPKGVLWTTTEADDAWLNYYSRE